MEDIADWTSDEVISLIANLDIIVETNQPTNASPMLSKEAFWNRLQESLANARSQDQIISKLQERLIGDFNRIYLCGSRCLNLDADMRREVEARVVAIRLSTPRKLRSNSRKRLHSGQLSVTPTSSLPARSVRPSPHRLTGLRSDSTDELAASQDSPKNRPRYTSELQTVSAEDEPEVRQVFEIRIEGRSDGSRKRKPIPSLQDSSGSFRNANEFNGLQIDDDDTLDPSHGTCELGVQDFSRETLQDILHDNMYLREKLSELTQIQNSLDHQVRSLHNQLRIQNGELRSQSGDSLEALSNMVVDLLRKLNDRREFVEPCLKSETENHHLPSSMWEQIERSMHNMSRILESLPTMEDFRYPKRDRPRQELTKDLDELLGKVFVDMRESALLSHFRSQVSVGDLVQAVVGAAVCEWVFESELRCTTMMKTPLSEALRYLMTTIRSEATFQNLYFAAHQLVVRHEHFKTVCLPRTASKLAGRLVGALSPLIKTKKRGRNTIRIKRDLKSIFQHALEIKIQVIVQKHMFRTIWPSHGSAYEESLMKTQSAESVLGDGELRNGAPLRVKLPLVPGLCYYSREKKAVDYCSFTKSDERDLGKPRLLYKAVVAIEL